MVISLESFFALYTFHAEEKEKWRYELVCSAGKCYINGFIPSPRISRFLKLLVWTTLRPWKPAKVDRIWVYARGPVWLQRQPIVSQGVGGSSDTVWPRNFNIKRSLNLFFCHPKLLQERNYYGIRLQIPSPGSKMYECHCCNFAFLSVGVAFMWIWKHENDNKKLWQNK